LLAEVAAEHDLAHVHRAVLHRRHLRAIIPKPMRTNATFMLST